MSLELLFLGTGTSAGVPMIGCRCRVCTSADPHDQRTRPSVLVSYHDPQASLTRRLLVDTTPDMRLQMIRHGIDRLDGVLFTHAHADHIFGMDDLRRFNALMQGPIDIYADQPTIQMLHRTFQYIFESHKNVNQTWVAQLRTSPIEVAQPFELFGAKWTPIALMHGRQPVLGFRVDYPVRSGATTRVRSFAYCTDVSEIPAESMPLLEGLDVLVLDGLRPHPHPTHLTIQQACDLAQRINARQTYLTHIAHDILHAEVNPTLPSGVSLSYDGLSVRFDTL